MPKTTPFYDLSTYRNIRYALNIAIINHFKGLLFLGDADRIIYSKTNYAFRKRTNGNHDLNHLDLPFMNFKIDRVEQGATDFTWFNHINNIGGIWIPEIGKKLRYTPVTVYYDATFYCHRYEELQYAYDELLWDDSKQTILEDSSIVINGYDINLSGMLGYDLQYNPTYDEQEFLDVARLHTIQLNFYLNTYIIKDNDPYPNGSGGDGFGDGNNGGAAYGIPEKIILDFYTWYNVEDDTGINEKHEFLVNFFDGTLEEV